MNQHFAHPAPAAPAAPAVSLEAVEQLLFLEADVLDRQQWDQWTQLYAEDCLYWVPSWRNEESLIEDPEMEVNMIYIKGKAGLEARLFRITSRDSYASLPLARTSHLIGNVRIVGAAENGDILVSAKWAVVSADGRRGKMVRSGWYDLTLAHTEDGLRIRKKKIILLEDMIDGTIDIFQI